MNAADDKRTICYVAAAIYGGATLLGTIESLLPGGESFSVVPIISALILCLITVGFGPRLSRNALFVLGPLGAAIIGLALAETRGYGDGAVLYVWPVLWTAYFYGNRATAFVVAWIGVVQAAALMAMPAGQGNPDSWLDVVVSMLIVAAVVRTLSSRNERMVAQLTAEARIDPLTGVLNRRGLDERMDAELQRARREQRPVAVVLFDLDHFKSINDVHGHDVGDRVLTWLGAVLQEQVRGVDIVARAGGEEFVVVLPGQDLTAAHAFAERVRVAIADEGALGARARLGVDAAMAVTVSGGVAAEVGPADAQALIDGADRALYRAKRAGRNQIVDADLAPQQLTAAA